MKIVKKCPPTPWQYRWIRSNRSIETFIAHMGYGLKSGIPLCCCLEWCVRVMLGQQAFGVELCGPDCYAQFVHCWFHREMIFPKEHRRKREKDDLSLL